MEAPIVRRALSVPAVAAVALALGAAPAPALDPGELYAVSGTPGLNAFLPGLASNSSLESGTLSTTFQQSSNTRKISDDGRYVTFTSFADGLSAADDDRYANVYVQDRDTGAIEVASTPAPGGSSEGDSRDPALSGDGRKVVFESDARLSPLDTDDLPDVYLRDLAAGTTTLVSRRFDTNAQGIGFNGDPDLSHNGRWVAFDSSVATTFVAADTDTELDVYAVDLSAGTPQLVLRSRVGAAGAKGNGRSEAPAVSDGGAVAFKTLATNLDDAGDPDPAADTKTDIYLNNGATTTLMSRATGAGVKGNQNSHDPAISDDGTVVAFMSQASNLDPADASTDYSVYTRSAGVTTLVSRAEGAGLSANGSSIAPTVSKSGGTVRVAFASMAGNFVPSFTENDDLRMWVRDVTGSHTTLVSRRDGAAGEPALALGPPSIATAGTAVAFAAYDPALSNEDDDVSGSVFVRDGTSTAWRSRPPAGSPWQRGASYGFLTSSPGARMSADGRYVVFVTGSSAYLPPGQLTTGQLAVRRDLLTGETLVVSRADGPEGTIAQTAFDPVISADGSKVAFASRDPLQGGLPPDKSQIFVRDIANGTTTLASRLGAAAGDDNSNSPSLSADGRRVAFESPSKNLGDPTGKQQVYVYDLSTGDLVIASRADGAGGALADQGGGEPSLDADGSRVAFQTYAKNLDPADTDTFSSIYVRDLATSQTILASRSTGGAVNDDYAFHPRITDDGNRVAFTSGSKNLDPADTDGGSNDVFLRDLAANTTTLLSQPGSSAIGISDYDLAADGSTVAWTTSEQVVAEDRDGSRDAYVRTLATGTTTLEGRKGDGSPLDGGMGPIALSADGGCLAITLAGAGDYFSGPVVPPGLPGSSPSPDFQTVLMRGLKPTCAPRPGGPGGGTKDTTAPVISGASLTNKRFRRGAKPTAVTAVKRKRRRAKVGTTFRFTLSEQATVTIALERRTKGRRVGKSCRKATHRLRKRKACTRYVKAGTLTRKALAQGARRVAFSGRIGRRKLALGRYRATLRATDAAGNRSKAKRLTFTIVRR